MLSAMILLAHLHCAPNANGTVDCYDAQKGGTPNRSPKLPNRLGLFQAVSGKPPSPPGRPSEG